MVKAFVAFLMLSAFLLPATIQFFHVLEGHEHKVCTDSSEHLHESAPDCSVFHFKQQNFHYQFTLYPEHIKVTFLSHTDEGLTPLVLDSYIPNNTQLRAPPVIS